MIGFRFGYSIYIGTAVPMQEPAWAPGMYPRKFQMGSFPPWKPENCPEVLVILPCKPYVSCSLNSLKGRYMGVYIWDYYKGY